MPKIVDAIYDGKAFWPEESVSILPDTRVRLIIDFDKHATANKKTKSFLQTARNLNIDGPEDWSANIREYLYGDKKHDKKE